MSTRTIEVAIWAHHDTSGRPRRAYRGQTVNLDNVHPADAERGERLGVFTDAESLDGVSQADPTSRHGKAGERPRQVAPKAAWVDYAVTCGMDRDHAQAITKAELIEAVDQLTAKTTAEVDHTVGIGATGP